MRKRTDGGIIRIPLSPEKTYDGWRFPFKEYHETQQSLFTYEYEVTCYRCNATFPLGELKYGTMFEADEETNSICPKCGKHGCCDDKMETLTKEELLELAKINEQENNK